MGSFRVFNQRTGRLATLVALVTATLVQGLVPVLASADSVTSRSIELSSSSASATGVTYKVKFTATKAAGAYVVEFCKNSPLIPDTCTAPTGFNAASAALGADGTTATAVTASTNKLIVTNTIAAAGSVTDSFTGIANPTTTADPLYARIVTYDNATDAGNYTSADLKTGAQDQGGVVIAITDTVGVSGVVRESLVFCVSGDSSVTPGTDPITANCTGAGMSAPVLKLGEDDGTGAKALASGAVSSGNIYTQISTNAASGAVVNLKSSATGCGGLKLIGSGACNILPSTTDVTAGNALFGVKTGAAVSDTGNGSLAIGTNYSSTAYKMNYVSGDATGVTGVYGDQIYSTPGYANSLNMPLTFGASVSPKTPAGTYSTDLSLIATGTF